MLVIGGDGSSNANQGIYVSIYSLALPVDHTQPDNLNWSPQYIPPTGEIITGIVVDDTYIYVSSYSLSGTSSPLMNKVHEISSLSSDSANKFSVRNLMANSCNPAMQSLASGITNGGVSVAKVYINDPTYSTSPNQPAIREMVYYTGTNYFWSNALLNISALFDAYTYTPSEPLVPPFNIPPRPKVDHLYTPSLGNSCNTGGFSIGVPTI
jgi:hypothetical protein